jgi:UDP-glucose 4-epimerase
MSRLRILITGGAGYIGSHLADALLAEGHQVRVVDDLSTGRMENIAHLLDRDDFRFVKGSILDQAAVEELVRQADLIYHLAAVVGVRHVVEEPLKGIQVNVRGTEIVLDLAHKHGVKALIASSSEVYGKAARMPLREDSDRVLGPTTVDRWSYSSAKAIDEHVAYIYSRMGLPVTIVRYFNSYGPRLDPGGYGSVVATFMGQALRSEPLTVYADGAQTRSFTYVSDTVRGTILAATREEGEGEAFNIGIDREISVMELAGMIRELTGSSSEIAQVSYEQAFQRPFEETRRRVPDVTKAAELLGFRAEIQLEEGLARTWEWFQSFSK